MSMAVEGTPFVDPARLEDTLRALLDVYSPSGKEQQVVRLVAERLQSAGLPVELHEVSAGRCNVEVAGEGPLTLGFVGHLDTVPAFDMDRVEFRRDGDRVAGLGAADMKGGCAAMIEAFLAVHAAGRLPSGVGLFLVVGEEESGDGTASLLQRRKLQTAVVGEPTELVPCLAHYGYVELLVRAFGYRRHAAMAGREHNAIQALLRALLQFNEWLESTHPEIVLNIRDLHSSESGFAVPDRCAAGVDLHLPPGTDIEAFVAAMREQLAATLDSSAAGRYEIDIPTLAAGFDLEAGGRLQKQLRSAFERRSLPWRPAVFMSHSDANLLHDAGCVPLIFGPGQLARAHTRDESISFAQVCLAAEFYADVLLHWEE